MGRVTNDAIIGTVGNITFYTVKGITYVRTKPKKRKKKRGQVDTVYVSVFRTVSHYGAILVRQMSNSFRFPFGRDTYNRLRGWMWNQYADHQEQENWPLSMSNNICQLHTEANLLDFLKTGITVSDRGKKGIAVNLPAINLQQDLKAPLRTTQVKLKFIAVSTTFNKEPAMPGSCIKEYEFNYTDTLVPAQEIVLDTKAAPGDIAIVTMAIEYKIRGEILYSKELRWLPAAVVAMGKVKV